MGTFREKIVLSIDIDKKTYVNYLGQEKPWEPKDVFLIKKENGDHDRYVIDRNLNVSKASSVDEGVFMENVDFVSNGKIRTDKLESSALTEVLITNKTTINSFIQSFSDYTFEKNDIIAILTSTNPNLYSLYFFIGGNKSTITNYLPTGFTKITISMVEGLTQVLSNKLEKPLFNSDYLVTNNNGIKETNIFYSSGKLGFGNNVPTEQIDMTGKIKTKAVIFLEDGDTNPYTLTYQNRRWYGTDSTSSKRSFLFKDYTDQKSLLQSFTTTEMNEYRGILNLSDGYKGFLKLDTVAPTIPGLYRLLQTGNYTNLIPAVDADGNTTTIVSASGKINDVYFNGTNFMLSAISLPQATQNIVNFLDLIFPVSNPTQTLYNNSLWEVKPGEVVTITDLPTNSPSSKWVEKIKELEYRSNAHPLKWDQENYDIEHITGVPQNSFERDLYGYAYVGDILNEDKLVNSIGYNITSYIPNNTVTVKVYAYSGDSIYFEPTAPGATLLTTKVIPDFNTNIYGRSWIFLDDNVLIKKGFAIVIVVTSDNINSLNIFRIPTGNPEATSSIRERRVTQTYLYLDFNGALTDEPIITLLNPLEKYDIQNKNNIFDKILLPPEFPAVVGKQLTLYKESVAHLPNKNKYSFRFRNLTYNWLSTPDNSGIYMSDDMLYFTPTEGNKTWSFAFEVLNENFQIVASKKFNIKTINKLIPTTYQGNHYIVVLADSLGEYNQGWFVKALSMHITEDIAPFNDITNPEPFNPIFIGSKITSTGISPEVAHESFQGKGWGFFTGSGSPLYIGGEINMQGYATYHGVPRIDTTFIQLLINDLGNAFYYEGDTDTMFEEVSEAALGLVTIMTSVDKGFPDMNVIISLEPYGGLYNGNEASKDADNLKNKMFKAYYKLLEVFEGFTNVTIVFSHLQIDRVNGYPSTEMVPNTYFEGSGIMVKRWSDLIHPIIPANKQNAGALYLGWRKAIG